MNKNKIWIYTLIGSLVILLVSILFYDFSNLEILKDQQISITNYDDGGTIGNSHSTLQKNDSSVCFTYTLGNKSPYPFAGIKINNPNGFDFSTKTITLNLQNTQSRRLHFFFAIQINDSLDCTFRHPIVCHPNQQKYTLYTQDFIIPTWWYRQKNLSEETIPPIDFSRGMSIMIENNIMQERGQEDQICIQSINIAGNNNTIFLSGGLSLFFFNLILFLLPYLLKKKKQEVVIEYKAQDINEVEPIELEKEELAQVVTYINQHYDNPELTLKVIKKEVRIHENKISSLIKSNFGISYKDYLHQIRIAEAKRLFQEANLNINEVATLVGYGNISTFNRAFKSKEGITPTDFLNK